MHTKKIVQRFDGQLPLIPGRPWILGNLPYCQANSLSVSLNKLAHQGAHSSS